MLHIKNPWPLQKTTGKCIIPLALSHRASNEQRKANNHILMTRAYNYYTKSGIHGVAIPKGILP
jgi:hypothetical protein